MKIGQKNLVAYEYSVTATALVELVSTLMKPLAASTTTYSTMVIWVN